MLRHTSRFSFIGRVLFLLAGLGIALSALADPPPHAPAHGWRKKNDPHYVGYTGHRWEHDYGIIEGRCNRAVIGTVVGAAIGGAIGSKVGDGDDRAVAIVVGTVLGAVIGREIGKEIDDGDRACMGHALELAHHGQGVRWTNDRTGVTFFLTPAAPKRKDAGCRSYKLQITAGSKTRTQDGRACRKGEGDWQLSV